MRILMIEDDEHLSEAVKIQLEHNGYQADICANGTDALFYVLQPVYSLVILDRMLPELDGLSILKLMRSNEIHTPVILATAIDSIPERIAGLDHGADDYITKPYDVGELLARIRALTRRPAAIETKDLLFYGDLTYDTVNLELSTRFKTIRLSKRESLLAGCFLRSPEQTISRQLIYNTVWGPDGEVEDSNLDTYIYYIRKHLKNLKSEAVISTVHGTGYKLEKKR